MNYSAWERVSLRDAGTWLSGGTPLTSEPSYWEGNLPWISAKSLTEFHLRDSDRRLTELGAQSGTKVVDKNAILMVVRGMSLKTEFRMGIAMRKLAFSQDCKALIARPGIDPLFLAYALKNRTQDILDMVDEAGHGTGRLQTDLLYALEIAVPNLDEQRGVAATLGALDDKIESNRRASEKASSLLDALAAEAASLLPQVRLGDFVEKATETCNPVKLGARRVDHFSLPAFDRSGRPERGPASEILSNKLVVPGRSILLSRLNPRINRSWWVTPNTGVLALASTEFLCIRARTDEDLAAAWLAVRTEEFMTELPRRVTGTSGSHQRVGPEDVLAISVPDMSRTPFETKQAALALLERHEQLNNESAGLAALRDALLPELLSGRIGVPEAKK